MGAFEQANKRARALYISNSSDLFPVNFGLNCARPPDCLSPTINFET